MDRSVVRAGAFNAAAARDTLRVSALVLAWNYGDGDGSAAYDS